VKQAKERVKEVAAWLTVVWPQYPIGAGVQLSLAESIFLPGFLPIEEGKKGERI